MHLLLPHVWIHRFSQISIISHKRNSNRYDRLKGSFEVSINFKRAKGLEGYSHVTPGKRKGLFVTLYICHCVHMEVRGQGVGVHSLPPCGSRDGLRLGGECLYLLSHLRPLTFFIWFLFWDCVGLECPVILYFSLPAAGSQAAPPGRVKKAYILDNSTIRAGAWNIF